MRKQYYAQALLNGIIITGSKKEAQAIVKSNGNIILKTKNRKNFDYRNIISEIPLIRGIVSLMNYLISFITSLNDSAGIIEAELEKKDKNKKVSNKLNLYLIDILTFSAIILSLFFCFLCLIIIPSILVYFINMIVSISILNSILEGIFRMIIFYILLKQTSKIPQIKDMYMYHGAFHKISQCYEAKENLILSNIKKYNYYDYKCGLSFIFNTMFVCTIIFSIIQVTNIGYLTTFNKIIYMFLIAGILYEIMTVLGEKSSKLFIGKIFQKTLVQEPTDEKILIVKKAFEAVIEEGEKENVKN